MDLSVNGGRHEVDVPADEPLLDVLREDLALTGTKPGCSAGVRGAGCGACTVLVDGGPTLSCATAVAAVVGRQVTTIEGLTRPDGRPHPVQRAFLDEQVAQCGWCTPAQVLTAVALLDGTPSPTPQQVRAALDAVSCRCGTQPRAVAAVLRAAAAGR